MKVSDYLNEAMCIMDMQGKDREGVIRELAQALKSSKKVVNEDKFVKDVLERESLGSTGIGHHVAIPHARTDAVKGFVIAFGRSTEGVDFKALDGQIVNFVFLMGADPAELNHYLRILAELSKLLMNTVFRCDLMAAKTASEVIDVIRKFEG